jgi:nucleotide-binding universal stress UspA family protein
MSYKSILVHLDTSVRAHPRLEIALRLARKFGAHLTALFATYTPDAGAFAIMAGSAEYFSAREQEREERRAALERLFNAELLRAQVDGRWLTAAGPAHHSVPRSGRRADLIIAGQPDPSDPEAYIGDHFIETLVLSAGRPVLLVPYIGEFPSIGNQILVAWDGGRESARAAYDALPFLAQARKATVVTVNGAWGEPRGVRVPGADIALTLARHAGNISVDELEASSDTPVGDLLLSHAHDCSHDMIVMGAYGHARWQELVLGGATRTILGSMTCPVLMSH